LAHLSPKIVGAGRRAFPVPSASPASRAATSANVSQTSDGKASAPTSPAAATLADVAAWSAPIQPLRVARAEFEERYIEQVLREHGGNISRAAAALGLSRAMLHRRLRAMRSRETRTDA